MIKHLESILTQSKDLIIKSFTHPQTNAKLELAYYLSLVDEEKINNYISEPYSKNIYPFQSFIVSNQNYTVVEDLTTLNQLLLKGQVLLQYEGVIYSFDALKYHYGETGTAQVECSIRGPQYSIGENPTIALNFIRNSYPSPELVVEESLVGRTSQTNLFILYDQRRVDNFVLEQVKHKLKNINYDLVLTSAQLEKLLIDRPKQLFPTILFTERTDRIASSISKGKIVLVLKGSQFALILPANFFEFMHVLEDDYESYWMTKMLVIVRYIALFVTTTLPGLYIAILSYNPELFRVQLAFSLVASRAVVPYPSFIEVFIMLFMIEMLIESSIRIPRLIGSTATTVGGLILGSAIQQAGLVSSIMIIVTSLVAISNFVLPLQSLGLAVRFLKYPIIVASIFFGITGVTVMMFIYIVYMCSSRSFGAYYFKMNQKTTYASTEIKQVGAK